MTRLLRHCSNPKEDSVNLQSKALAPVTLLLLLSMVAVAVLVVAERTTSEEEVASTNLEETSERVSQIPQLLELMDRQATQETQLLDDIAQGDYTLDAPFVRVDPYGISPLTALVAFSTPEPVQISIHVTGDDPYSHVTFTFDGYHTTHQIPVYGMYAGRVNEVVLTAVGKDSGEHTSVTLEIETGPLPDLFSDSMIMTEATDAAAYQPGFNFTYSLGKSAYDMNGDYRWVLNTEIPGPIGLNSYQDGTMLLSTGAYYEGDVVFFEMNLLGKILSAYSAPYGVHHDIEVLPNGNLLATGSSGETVEDFNYEIDIQTGEIVHTLDYAEMLQRTRKLPNFTQWDDNDWLHINDILYDTSDGSVIISSNQQSAVFKHSYPEGELQWILSPPDGWANLYEQYLLTPIGEGFEYSYGQHAPVMLPDYDNNPDTIDLLLFDNGRGRHLFDAELQRAIVAGEVVAPEDYSRMVHYRIDEVAMTIEQIWQFGKEEGEALFSNFRGSALLLDNGNRLGCYNISVEGEWGYYAKVAEVNEAGEYIWEAILWADSSSGQLNEYRQDRLPLYDIAANDPEIGTAIQNLVSEEVLMAYDASNSSQFP